MLDPFLPWGNKAQQYKELMDAFGDDNLGTILKNVREADRAELVYSLLFEAGLRTKDPVMGAYGQIVQLRSELEREEASLKDLGLEDITAEAMEKETLPADRVLDRDCHPCLSLNCDLDCPFLKCVPHIDVNIASATEICQVYEHDNVVSLLKRVEEKDWSNLVNSLSFEVKARRDHPVTGCHGLVLVLESKVKRVKSILKLQGELTVRERELKKWKTVNFQQLVEENKRAGRLEGIGKYTPATAARWGKKRSRSKGVRRMNM